MRFTLCLVTVYSQSLLHNCPSEEREENPAGPGTSGSLTHLIPADWTLLLRAARDLSMVLLPEHAWWAFFVEPCQIRVPLAPYSRPGQRAPDWEPMMELVRSVQMPTRLSGPVWATSWRPLSRGRRGA